MAYAENQSMFLDSLVRDAAWRGRYAKDRQGSVLPWAVHQRRRPFPGRAGREQPEAAQKPVWPHR